MNWSYKTNIMTHYEPYSFGGAEPDEPLEVVGVIIVAAKRMDHAFN